MYVCMYVDALIVVVAMAEVPLLDGSAIGWVDVIQQAGLEVLDNDAADGDGGAPPAMLAIEEPIVATHPHDPNSAVYAFPSPSPIFSIGIEFLSVSV